MLKYLQKKVLVGRDFDVSNESSQLSGDTNYILVDRDNILNVWRVERDSRSKRHFWSSVFWRGISPRQWRSAKGMDKSF